ncbi:LrgB family protein [Scopulibacillus cellulosilyticus]|uniref:LrgB family protein n=1 Tax=Scopulibacillus cellulosilyticus TaxID=2665665 RepID=A0ABW2PZ66_9BACL
MLKATIAIAMILLTIVIYFFMSRLYRRFNTPFLIPALSSTLCLVLLLILFGVPYKTYMLGGQFINLLLGPAVVSLAYPLYKQRAVLLQSLIPILSGVIVGSIVGIVSGLLFAKSIGVEKSLVMSLVPKSVTTPVAMGIAEELGGRPSLTVIFVMIAGFTGAVIGPYILKWLRISSILGKGIALGSASHAIGTSKAFEYGEKAATVSSVAMTLCAILDSIFGPLIVWIFYS